MSVIDKACEWAVSIAKDNTHGYDQGSRWGHDYDCSSLVISAYKHAGLPLTCTYTGNMKTDFLRNGFVNVYNDVNCATGAGLKRGDVLLNEVHHTALYIGNGEMVEATGNERGGVTGGQPGDQTGKEIAINPYHNYGWGVIGWDCVLRYEGKVNDPTPTDSYDTYTVQKGDSLWSIATTHGMDYLELARINGISTQNYIYPGQVLKLKDTTKITVTPDNQIYTVRSGDSLWQIADALLGNGWVWYKIANANGLKFPYTIYPGQTLKIPKE